MATLNKMANGIKRLVEEGSQNAVEGDAISASQEAGADAARGEACVRQSDEACRGCDSKGNANTSQRVARKQKLTIENLENEVSE